MRVLAKVCWYRKWTEGVKVSVILRAKVASSKVKDSREVRFTHGFYLIQCGDGFLNFRL